MLYCKTWHPKSCGDEPCKLQTDVDADRCVVEDITVQWVGYTTDYEVNQFMAKRDQDSYDEQYDELMSGN